PPPGAKPTTMVTARLGQVWASAERAAAASMSGTIREAIRRENDCMNSRRLGRALRETQHLLAKIKELGLASARPNLPDESVCSSRRALRDIFVFQCETATAQCRQLKN